jgi:hypothetical protein
MAEKSKKKTIAISLRRARIPIPKIVFATGFTLRPVKPTGTIDILLEVGGQKGERVVLDPIPGSIVGGNQSAEGPCFYSGQRNWHPARSAR